MFDGAFLYPASLSKGVSRLCLYWPHLGLAKGMYRMGKYRDFEMIRHGHGMRKRRQTCDVAWLPVPPTGGTRESSASK
ncbi:hypothetical protein EBB59_02480 [Lysobacter pythonis]|uniref:Uncharacterized protein n=1 Tax=Solilutibacter pythonis TaxID=2483112 RepID=A0A3M2HXW0_9GAMM|nr:hypothetical protein EBB59_02480 [Lysobacter pythonis]